MEVTFTWQEKLVCYAKLCRLHRPIGIFLLLWPTLWALWLAAKGIPPIHELIVFVLGVVTMRSAGCVINDFADRKIDGHVQRTKDRPIVAGWVSEKEALAVFGVLVVLAFLLVLSLNWLTIYMSGVAVFLAAIYPFMKRHTHLPQVFLGAAFGWAIPMAYTAIRGELSVETWILFATMLMWTVAYDTLYAMTDRADDLKIGVKSTAILFGENDRIIVGTIQGITILGLLMLGAGLKMAWPYYTGIGVASLLFVYQHWLIREREEGQCFKAFLNNHYVGLAIFVGIVLNYSMV
jgi:4-hydroxybenzoate polyprenyltransferase